MARRIIDIALKVLFAAAVTAAMFSACYHSFADNTTYSRAVSGREFLRDLTFPKADEASFTGPVKWDKSSWLFDFSLYAASYIMRGMQGLRYIKFAALVFMAFFIFLAVFKKQKGKYLSITMPVGLLGFVILCYHSAITPALVAPVLTAYFVFVLEQEPSKKNDLLYYSLPFAALFWANTSQTSPAAAVLTAVYTFYYIADANEVPEKREKYNSPAILISFAGVALATLLSPAFTAVYINPAVHFSAGIAAWKQELFSRGLEPGYFILLCLYLLVFIIVLALNEKSSDVGRKAEFIKDMAMSVILALACAADMDFIPVFVAATLPAAMYYTSLIFRWNFVWPRKWTENDLAGVKITLYAVMIPLVCAFGAYKFLKPAAGAFPDGAIAYINAEKPPQNLFIAIDWASCVYFSAPAYKLMYDGGANRPGDVKKEYDIIMKNELDPMSIMEKYGVNSALLKIGSPLAARFTAAGYKTAYFDGQSVLLVNPAKTTNYLKYIDPENDANFYEKDKYDDAAAELKAYAEKYPGVAAHILMARLYGEQDKKKEETYLEDTISDFPEEYPLYNFMGRFYYEGGDYSSAMDMWDQSKQRDEKINMLYKDAQKRENAQE